MILRQDALLTGMGICNQRISTMQFLLSFDSPIVMWVLYNRALLADNSWAIHPKYFRTNFIVIRFQYIIFFKTSQKGRYSNNSPQGTSLRYYPASWKEKKKTQKQCWQWRRPVKEKDDNFLLNIKTYVALLKIWWQRLVLMANDDCLQKKDECQLKKVGKIYRKLS